jgi:Fe-S cluster assembly iron-binding protein IscA
MLELTEEAATAIAHECAKRRLPATAGVRIYPRRTKNDTSIEALVVEFVSSPEDDDIVVQERGANVFLARGVDEIIGSRVLDARGVASPPQLLLRARRVGDGQAVPAR